MQGALVRLAAVKRNPLWQVALVATCLSCTCGTTSGSGTPRFRLLPAAVKDRPRTGVETPVAVTCPTGFDLVCPTRCCPVGSTCLASGDCGPAAPSSVSCPPSAPVLCSSPGGSGARPWISYDSSARGNHASLDAPAVLGDGMRGTALWLGQPTNTCGPSTTAVATASANGLPIDNGPVTVELWVRSKAENNGGLVAWQDRVISFDRNSASLVAFGCNILYSFSDHWRFVAVVYEAGWTTVYFEGQQMQRCQTASFATPAGGQVTFGSKGPSSCAWALDGALDEVRIVDHALSAADILADFKARQLLPINGTVGLWHFDEGGPRCCPAGSTCNASGGCGSASAATGATCSLGAGPACGSGCCGWEGRCDGGTCAPSQGPLHGQTISDPCDGGYCPSGLTCSEQQCCPPSLPAVCGGECCPSNVSCVDLRCGCADGLTPCGSSCYPDPGSCTSDIFTPTCPADRPQKCGSVCCPSDLTCGSNSCQCGTAYPVPCVSPTTLVPTMCCLPGATCLNGTCGCPSGREACGDRCCDLGQACVDGTCQAKPSSGGSCPSGLWGSTRACYVLNGQRTYKGVTATCIDKAQFEASTGLSLPSSCTEKDVEGCADEAGNLARPCCEGLVCAVGTPCGQTATGAFIGQCVKEP